MWETQSLKVLWCLSQQSTGASVKVRVEKRFYIGVGRSVNDDCASCLPALSQASFQSLEAHQTSQCGPYLIVPRYARNVASLHFNTTSEHGHPLQQIRNTSHRHWPSPTMSYYIRTLIHTLSYTAFPRPTTFCTCKYHCLCTYLSPSICLQQLPTTTFNFLPKILNSLAVS